MFSVYSIPFLSHGMCFGEKCHIAAETMKHVSSLFRNLSRIPIRESISFIPAGHDELLVIQFS